MNLYHVVRIAQQQHSRTTAKTANDSFFEWRRGLLMLEENDEDDLVHRSLVNLQRGTCAEQNTSSLGDMTFRNKIGLLSEHYLLSHSCAEFVALRNQELVVLMYSAVRELLKPKCQAAVTEKCQLPLRMTHKLEQLGLFLAGIGHTKGQLTFLNDSCLTFLEDRSKRQKCIQSLGETMLLPLVMSGPQGLEFLVPVTLNIPHCADRTASLGLALKATDSEKNLQVVIQPLIQFR